MNNDNSTNNNSVSGIKAKKISQLNKLPDDFYPTEDNPNEEKLKNLYFALGFNMNDEIVTNYKMNIDELITMLIRTGKISGTSNTHTISYVFEHITTNAPAEFSGKSYELTLIPDLGYDLPDEISVAGVSSYEYNKNTGYLYLASNKKINFIIITATAVPIEYTFGINLSGMNCENKSELINRTYHIGDRITVNTRATDDYNYDAPDREQVSLSGLSIINYEKIDSEASMILEITGASRYTTVTLTAQRICNYYFGYSIEGDTKLNYDNNGIPYEAGNNFATMLMRGRNKCPIPFIDGFDYGNGITRIADDNNVFIVIPRKYYNVDKNLYVDDNWNAYKLQSGNSAIEIPIQSDPNTNNLMIYNFIYDDVEYSALCISREGKEGHQSFIPVGSISEYVYKIEWNTEFDNKTVVEGNTISSENDSITLYRLDGTQQTISLGFTVEIEPKDGVILGSYANGIYTAPETVEDTTYVKLICTYISHGEEFKEYATLTIIKGGTDENLCGIEWRLNISELNSLDTFTIMPNSILGKYGDEEVYEMHAIEQPEALSFFIESGGGEINGFEYSAPRTVENIIVKIKVAYKGFTDIRSITINGFGFDSLYWPTDLPKAIYDIEQLDIDTTLYKIIGTTNASMELIEDTNHISLVSSMERLSNGIFLPNEVNSDTEVKFTISYNGFSVEKFVTVKSSTISPSIIGAYWYIGQYEPTGYTNPENDLIDPSDPNDKTGWREIPNSFSSYKTNPLYSCPANNESRITFYDDATYYVAIPTGFLFKNILGEIISINAYKTITIGNKSYDVYKFDSAIDDYDETFTYNIYYNSTSSMYYIYWGAIRPTSDMNPEDKLSILRDSGTEYTAGWYLIGPSITNYTQATPWEMAGEFNIWEAYDEDYNDILIDEPSRYILIPKHMIWTIGDVDFTDENGNYKYDNNLAQKIGEIEIQGINYYLYEILNDDTKISTKISLYYKE